MFIYLQLQESPSTHIFTNCVIIGQLPTIQKEIEKKCFVITQLFILQNLFCVSDCNSFHFFMVFIDKNAFLSGISLYIKQLFSPGINFRKKFLMIICNFIFFQWMFIPVVICKRINYFSGMRCQIKKTGKVNIGTVEKDPNFLSYWKLCFKSFSVNTWR